MDFKNIVIMLAGGSGGRYGKEKQFETINGIPVFIQALKNIKDYYVVLTVPKNKYVDAMCILYTYTSSINPSRVVSIIEGGATRQESCYNAIRYIEQRWPECKRVAVTEASRPCITSKTVSKCLKEVKKNNAVITACKSINTSVTVIPNTSHINNILDRKYQYDLLMPECFDFKKLKQIRHHEFEDYTSLLETYSNAYLLDELSIVEISRWEGLKLTYKEDYDIIKYLLSKENI